MDYQEKTREELIAELLKLRQENEDLNALLNKQADALGREEAHDLMPGYKEMEHKLNERIKELSCHNQIAEFVANADLRIEEVIQKIVDIIPPAWQYPDYAQASITIHNQTYQTAGFRKTRHCQTQDILQQNKKIGQIDVCYNDEVDFAAPVFLPEEANLLFTIAVRLSGLMDKDEETLRLKKTENKYQSLIENINDIIYEYDDNGILTYISPVVEKTFGFRPADIIGKNFITFIGGGNNDTAKHLKKLQTQKQTNTDYQIPAKDGSIRWANLSTKAVFDGDRFIGGTGVVTDITDLKLKEMELNRSEQLYHSILNASPDCITITNLEGKILVTSNKAHEMFGVDVDYDFRKNTNLDFIHPDDRERAISRVSDMLTGVFRGAEEYIGVRADGSSFDIEVNGDIIRNATGEPVNFIFITRDISQRKQAESQLEATKASFQHLVENINDVIYEVDEYGTVKYISPAIYKLIGYYPEEIIGKSFLDFVGDNREVLAGRLIELKTQSTSDNEYMIYSRTGELRWIRLSSKGIFKDGEFKGGSGTMVNITEKKLIELELNRSEALYRSILNSSPDNITITDLQGNIILSSPNGTSMFGYEPEFELKGQPIARFIHESERDRVYSNVRDRINNEFVSVSNEFKAIRKDGSVFYVEVNWDVLRDSAGKPVNLIFILRDISERKRTEEKLQKSEETYRQMVERINDVVFNVSNDGTIIYVSPAIKKVLGYTSEELTGKNFFNYMYPEDIPALMDAFKNLHDKDSSYLEYRYYKNDGTVRWVRSTTTPVFEDGVMIGGIGVLTDIHERKIAEEKLRGSEMRYKSFFEGNTSIMILVNPETGEIKDANPAASNYYGWSKQEICSMNISEINVLTPDEIAAEMQLAKSEERKHFFFRHKLASGEIRDVEVYSGPVVFGGNTLLYSIVHDITERVLIENALRDSEEKYRSIFETIQDTYYEASLDGILLEISPSIEVLSGGKVKRDDFLGKSFLSVYKDPDARALLQQKLLAEGRVIDYELDFKVGDFEIPVSISSNLIPDVDGKPLKVAGSMRDISERKKSEAELKASEEKYRLLFSNNPQPMWIYDLETLAILEVNQSSMEQYGYSREEFLQMTIKDVRPSEDIPELLDDVHKATKNKSVKGVWRHIWKNGELRYVEISAQSVDFNGRKARHVLINDITERIQTENEIKDKSILLTNLIVNLKEGILLEDVNRKIVLTNQLFCDMFGIPVKPELLIGSDCSDSAEQSKHLFEDQDKFVSDIERILREKKYILNDELQLADGRYFERDYIPTYVDNTYSGHLWKYRDITERKLAEKSLQESDDRFSQVVAQSQEVVWEVDAQGLYTYVSPMAKDVYGYAPDELIGKLHFYDLCPIEERSMLTQAAFEIFGKKEDIHNLVNKVLKPDFTEVILLTNGIPMLNEQGELIGYRGIDADITEQKRAEMELTKFRTISDQANYGAFISSLEGNIQYVNPCLAQMLGWEAEELIGKHITVLQSEDHLHRLQEIGNLIRNQGGFVSEELHYKRKDGQTFPTLMTAKVIFNENQEAQYVSSTLIDITERKLNEENLLRLTRLRSLTSNINQAIVTEKTKDKLLEKVCSIAIVSGKFQMTWIGLVDELTMSVKPYLIDGFEDGYLSQIKPISVQDNQEGRGPTGTALREGRPFICNDIANDPNMIIWRDEALKRNYRSAIAIPIKQFDEIYGVLNLYSTQPNFFNEDEVQLLVEVVDNIGNALEAIETEAERKLAEAELRKLSQVVEQSPVSIVITNLDGNIEYANPKARETTGYLYEELIGTNPRVLQSGETSKDEYTTLWETISVGKEWRGLFHNKKKTGELYWESSTISPILDENGSILNYVAIKEDITQKKQAEEDLMKFRTVSDMATYGTAINGVNGEFQYVNKSWAEMHGYEVEELIGKNLRIGHNEEQLKEVDGLIGDLFRTGEMKPTEVWHVRRDGSVFPTLMSANVIYDANHNPLFLSATCIDITDLKKSEEALILSESALNYAQSIANMGSWEVDYLSGKTIWSKNLFQLYEIDTYMDEIPMEYFHDMVHPDDLPLFESSLKVITEFRQSLTFDIRLILPNGKQKWIQNNVVPVVENDVLIGLRGVNMDVTDKKQKDDQLKIQNERLNAIVQAMPDLIFAIDTHGTYLEYFASDTAKGSLIKTTDIVGSNLKDLFDEKTAISHLNHINECVKEQKLVTYEYTLPQGEETLYFEARTVPLGTDKVLAFVRDITAGKHAEIEIKKLSQAVEQSPILVVISDLDGHIEYVNPAFTNVTGYSSEEVIGKKTSILKSGKTDISTYTDLWNTISLGMEWHNEWINKKKDGELYWESVSITPIHDESGNIINYLAVKQDITERKKAEQEIRELNENLELKIQQRTEQLAKTNNDLLQSIEERKRLDEALIASEQSYQTVVENVNEVIFQTDAEGLWLFLNKAWTEVTGFSVDESLGQLFLNYVHPDDRQRNMELFAPLINREKDHCRHEVRYLTKDGGYRWIEVFARLGLNEKDEITGTYGTLQDITERKRAEDFENEMLQLSPQLTGITANEIKSALNLALSRIGKFLNADRAYIFEFTGGKDIMSNTYEWCNADINPEIDNLQNIPCEMLPMWMDELNKHRNIIIPSIVDLPWNWQAEKEILEPQGIQSLIAIPMLIEDQLIGFVGLDSVLVKRDYSIAEINILKVWSSMLASLINNYRTEGLLEQTRQNFETFFNTIDDFLWVLDDTGNIIHINNTVINRLGYTPEELESTSILKVHPTDRRDEAERVVGEMLQGVTEFCPVPVVTKNGQQIPVETRVKHGNWNGQPAIFGVSKDISKIQLSEQKFSTAFQSNSALMAISIFDGGQYLDVNNTFLKVLDYSREEVIGRTNAELDFFPDKTLRAQIVKSIEENGPVRELEAVIRRKDGELRTIILSADTIYLGETKCLLTVSVDITERKLAEEEIRKARMEAEKANVAKSEFLSRMSHELRTPMNSILGFAQLLEMGQMNPSQKKGVNHIMRSGKHLLSLINEVLDISRIEAGRLSISIEPIKIDSILEEMIDVLKPMTEDNEVNIRIVPSEDNKLFVNFDRQSMKQVMLNLLNNAVKYNRPGGSVTISTQLLPKTADGKSFVRISIADTGLGISTEDLPKLFTPFERIGASKTAIEGTGLGLAVVKKLIDAMGGLLGVTSTLGEGTTFWIDLPKAESQLETLHQLDNLTGEHSEQVEKRGTILYIEDNTSNIELVEQILLMQRPEIQLISNSHGKYAVKLASEYKPDLILLDLNLPDIHGSEVLKRLLKNEKTKNIPVVVISADAMHKQVENLLNAGARTYLTKPLEVVSFLKVIDEYIFE